MEQEITKERLKELLDTERKLRALEVAGVDNWDGYDFALECNQLSQVIERSDPESSEVTGLR